MVAALAAHCAYAQTASGQDPSAGPTVPTATKRPPAPPELAPLAPDFQAAMANSQLQTYRYNQLTEQALALKKLCETGFGPADICPKMGTAGSDGVAANSSDLPIVAEISGPRTRLHAILAFPDGRRATVHSGSILPNGSVVGAVTDEDVRVGAGPGREAVLSFFGGQTK